jgi:hypothetical protein
VDQWDAISSLVDFHYLFYDTFMDWCKWDSKNEQSF